MYDGWTPLLLAAGRQSPALVALLLSHGAYVDAWEAAALGDVSRLQSIVDNDPDIVRARRANDAPPLHFAATVPVAQLLIERGAPLGAVDKYGSTAARSAAYGRFARRPIARFLMKATGERDPWLLAALDDVDGLAEMARAGVNITTRVRNGINPASGFGELPIHTAAALGNVASVRFLVAQGADPNATVERGVRPLHYAAKANARHVAEALLQAGADPLLKDDEHEGTASDWARFFGNFELAGFLETVE
jgi:ankyrin repeat protein